MGLNPGKKNNRRLPDLGIYPPVDDCYEPDLGEPTDVFVWPFPLVEGHAAGLTSIYRKDTSTLLAFAAWQVIYVDDKPHPVFRIDTWHGTVHRHDFTSSGNNSVTTLQVIPMDHPERVIEVWRDKAEDVIMTEWEQNVRRWRGDT